MFFFSKAHSEDKLILQIEGNIQRAMKMSLFLALQDALNLEAYMQMQVKVRRREPSTFKEPVFTGCCACVSMWCLLGQCGVSELHH